MVVGTVHILVQRKMLLDPTRPQLHRFYGCINADGVVGVADEWIYFFKFKKSLEVWLFGGILSDGMQDYKAKII